MVFQYGSRWTVALLLIALLTGCRPEQTKAGTGKKTIIVTYAVLGAVVQELAGNSFQVAWAVPNGMDVHEWEPSAKDVEALTRADLIVENGLGLEGGMGKALDQARRAGVGFFTASEHIQVRTVGLGEGLPTGDPDQAPGAGDPHLWTDPLTVRAVVDALAQDLKQRFGVDLSARAAQLDVKLMALNREIQAQVETLPPQRRCLVTGHESLGYFAQRYGFRLVGAVIPSLTTEAESSAAGLATLIRLIHQNQVSVVFTELGTPRRTVEALAREAGVTAVPLTTHALPEDGRYETFERDLAGTIVKSLK